MVKIPKISFGIIVLNGEPFTKYCLRSIYPYAYEIIIVEGGHEDTASVTNSDGHSIDGTLETIYRFKKEEDPENKLIIITREGHWIKRDEYGHDRTHQSKAFAERASGDYLWQIDIDEFYIQKDIEKIINIININSKITAISFKTKLFWGGLDYCADGWYFRRGANIFHRLFKWGTNYKYITHEPPTVIDNNGCDLRKLNWLSGEETSRQNIYLYHYALLFPHQVKQKAEVYRHEKPEICSNIIDWANSSYFSLKKPFRVERHYWYPSWLLRYKGNHPEIIYTMMQEIEKSNTKTELRKKEDIEKILKSKLYKLGIIGLKILDPIDQFIKFISEFRKKIKLSIKRRMNDFLNSTKK